VRPREGDGNERFEPCGGHGGAELGWWVECKSLSGTDEYEFLAAMWRSVSEMLYCSRETSLSLLWLTFLD
jgi:hypothetical protein